MKKITAISLALLTLTLSLNVGIAFHFCGGKLAQSKFILGYGKATCGMEENDGKCEKKSSASFDKNPCCQDQFQQIITDDYQPVSLTHISTIFINGLTTLSYNSFVPYLRFNDFLLYRSPPDITSTFLPFIRVFVI